MLNNPAPHFNTYVKSQASPSRSISAPETNPTHKLLPRDPGDPSNENVNPKSRTDSYCSSPNRRILDRLYLHTPEPDRCRSGRTKESECQFTSKVGCTASTSYTSITRPGRKSSSKRTPTHQLLPRHPSNKNAQSKQPDRSILLKSKPSDTG
ncbi:hypothetical protein E4T56_gene268 [Termitomyces sp. T112]|nr:hypothetical protein E4T56_gene268 [Termitomyces sp. T112]